MTKIYLFVYELSATSLQRVVKGFFVSRELPIFVVVK